jgi:uncharacterized RDD family membrane protein YckC
VIQGNPAGLISRVLAASIDLAATVGAVLFSYLGIAAIAFVVRPRSFRWPDPGVMSLGGIWWALLVVYLTFGWTTSGRTVGKQVMGLRVVSREGDRLRVGRALIRAILCAVFPIGLLWCAIDRQGRAVHDLVVGSRVTYDWIPRSPAQVNGSVDAGREG